MTILASARLDRADTARFERMVIARIGAGKFKLWLRPAQIDIRDAGVCVTAQTRFAADWIERHFRADLLAVAQELLGVEATVHIDAEAPPAPRVNPEPVAPRQAALTDPPPRPRWGHNLGSFVVGPGNELAYNSALAVADSLPHAPRVLFLHSGCGLGKTHLLQGIGQRCCARSGETRVRYTTAEEFTNQFLHALKNHRLPEFRRRVRRLDLLLVDDVHFLTGKPSTQDEFLHTFDAVGRFGARVVLASDAHPKQTRSMRDALVSRFMSGMVVRIDPPDEAMREKLVVELARRRGLSLGEGVARRVAQGVRGSTRELEGAVTKLAALRAVEGGAGVEAGHAAVTRLLDSAAPIATRRPVRVERILEVVCERLGVERKQVMGRGRHARVVLARSAVIHIARKLTAMSYPELAAALQRPNHSSIVTAAHRIQKQVRDRKPLTPSETTLALTYDELLERLQLAVCE